MLWKPISNMRKIERRISMRTNNFHSDTLSGTDLFNFKTRKYFESKMNPYVMEKLNMQLDLEPFVWGHELRVSFYDSYHRVKLWVPVNLSFSVSQMLEAIYKEYEKDLPSLLVYFSSPECFSNGFTELRKLLNEK